MLARLELTNFRCFESHAIEFPMHALMVGKNNAGKSTTVEGLRLISLVTERMKGLPLRSPPREFDLPARSKGFQPSLESIFIHRESLFHRYSDPPARVKAIFTNKSSIEVHIGRDALLHAVVIDSHGRVATTRTEVESAKIPRVSILPQIAPLALEETRLTDAYVRANLQTLRSSMHFRNQLNLLSEHFGAFKRKVSETWTGLKVIGLELPGIMDKEGRISLLIRDGDFSAEVAWMGHGLQMWLQTMWFLCRNTDSSVLILDEPDVYMHADLQRKLIRMLLRDRRQFIVATHSPEMLAEVEPESIVILNRDIPVSRSATSSEAVQRILQHVGSVHNLSLARLGLYQRILLVEGHDVPMLKLFQNAMKRSQVSVDALPNSDIEGWSKWPAVLTMSNFFRKNGINDLKVFCVLDRDYHSQAEIDERLEEAKKAGINLKVWAAKEIENYAVSASAIASLTSERAGKRIEISEVAQVIEAAAEELKESAIDDYSEAVRVKEKCGANKSNPLARRMVEERWRAFGGPQVVSGKKLFARVAKWCQDKYKVSISISAVIKQMQPEDVPSEVSEFVNSVTEGLEAFL